METPYTGAEGMLPRMKGDLTIRNEKSLRLSYSLVNIFPLPSISKCRSGYETDFNVCSILYFKFFGIDAMYKIPETIILHLYSGTEIQGSG